MASVCTIVAIQRKSRGYGGSRRDLWEDDNSMGFGWWNGFVGCMWYGIPSKSRVVGPPRREELEVVALLRAEGGWHKPESPLKIGCQLGCQCATLLTIPAQLAFFRALYHGISVLPLFSPSSPLTAMRSLATILISLSLPLHAFAAHAVNPGRRHADVALRPRQQFSGERMTYYDITTGTYVPLFCLHRPCLIISLQYGLWWQLCCE